MTDWSTIFGKPTEPGANATELSAFAASIGKPLTSAEVAEAKRSQTNPFPADHPQHKTWKPFDPSGWKVPSQPLPASYLSLLAWSCGAELTHGQRVFQFFPLLDPSHGVRAMLLAYQLPQYMPGAIPFAFNGGGVFYLFDMREPAKDGEFPIVVSHAGNLGWDRHECVVIAHTFMEACQDQTNIETLM